MTEQPKDKPFILLVDDHPHNLVALEAVLGTAEYHLITASSGAEALALINVYDFALILLDIHMPEMDGYEVARRLKASAKTREIPLFLVTAVYREDPYVQRAYEVGAVEYFSKPFNPELLRLKVSIYAELHRKSHSLKVIERQQKNIEAELRAVMENVDDAIYVGDESGITRYNAAARQMFGLNGHKTCSFQMRDPESKLPIPSEEQPLARALRGEQCECLVLIRQADTGVEAVITCAAAPIRHADRVIGAVVVNSTVTQG